jgi:hypothetical protein
MGNVGGAEHRYLLGCAHVVEGADDARLQCPPIEGAIHRRVECRAGKLIETSAHAKARVLHVHRPAAPRRVNTPHI